MANHRPVPLAPRQPTADRARPTRRRAPSRVRANPKQAGAGEHCSIKCVGLLNMGKLFIVDTSVSVLMNLLAEKPVGRGMYDESGGLHLYVLRIPSEIYKYSEGTITAYL